MKNLKIPSGVKITLFTLACMNLFVSSSFAATSFNTSVPNNIQPNQNFTVTVNVNSDTLYNAINVSLSYNNLTYVSSSVVNGWATIAGPTNAAGIVSFTGALLGQGSASTGSKPILNVTFLAPAKVTNSSVSTSGTLAQANSTGTQIGINSASSNIAPAQPASATPSALPNTGFIDNYASLLIFSFGIIGIGSYILIRKKYKNTNKA